MNKINKDELEKLKKELEKEPETYEKETKIIYDERQYAVRIPARVIKIMGINRKLDKIRFKVDIPSKISESPTLEIKLVKYENKQNSERHN